MIRSEVRERVAEIVISNPPVNALPVAGWLQLADTIREHGRDAAVRAVIIAADPRIKGFQAGVDIKELAADPTRQAMIDVNRGCREAFAAVYDCEVPVIVVSWPSVLVCLAIVAAMTWRVWSARGRMPETDQAPVAMQAPAAASGSSALAGEAPA